MTREQEQDALIAAWSATQPEEVRRKVAALPPLDEGPSHEVGASEDAATWERPGQAEWADPARWCDAPLDWLQDEFDLTEGQAEGVAKWARGLVRREREGSEGALLTRTVMRLATGAQANMPVMVWALAFQMGISDACETHATPSGKAREFGVTRALMSYWMRYWEDLLGFRDQTYAKSKEARANMRAARMRVVERQGNAERLKAEILKAGSALLDN
jgi:hypothetical protein